uniref:Uncharacterized protein n=1 Tax=Heterorhabditis bacteriophora TaxID=37862 RepID=A0A1I7WXD1_HETBA
MFSFLLDYHLFRLFHLYFFPHSSVILFHIYIISSFFFTLYIYIMNNSCVMRRVCRGSRSLRLFDNFLLFFLEFTIFIK